MTNDIKIGVSQQIGPLEVWPLALDGLSRAAYKTPPINGGLKFEEYDNGDGPRVSCIEVENLLDKDYLIPSGWIVGAELLQVRSFNNAELIPAGQSVLVDVSCVEQGRWSSGKNKVDGGRAPITIMAAGWDFHVESQSWKINRQTRQSRVWSQVSRQENRSGVRETSSLQQIMREDSVRDSNLYRLHQEIQGNLQLREEQNGVLVAYEGEPLLMEFFSDIQASENILRETLNSLVFDLDQFKFRPTAKSHVDRFIRDSGIERMHLLSRDEWSLLMGGGNRNIDTKATLDSDQKIMHLTAINRSHRILMGV
jgi:hypothetical protein